MEGVKVWWIISAAVLLLMVPRINSWGKEGHFAICKIAQEYLTEEALKAVQDLLPAEAEGDLANVCDWADQVRYRAHYGWSRTLHYVDTPDFLCNYEYTRDCHDTKGRKDKCVTAAIYNYTEQLLGYYNSNSETNYNLTEALMFLSHFVGDVHQPLHVGFIGDEGGNTITVRWYRRKTNLHHLLTTNIIETAVKTFYDSDLALMIQALQNNITDEWPIDIPAKENCNKTVCPDPYASESVSLACKFAYRNATPGSTLKDEYFLSRLPVVEKRLAQSGVRLAAILNSIFTSSPSVAQL
nr:endonuclease 4-like [Ipomoea batatas]